MNINVQLFRPRTFMVRVDSLGELPHMRRFSVGTKGANPRAWRPRHLHVHAPVYPPACPSVRLAALLIAFRINK